MATLLHFFSHFPPAVQSSAPLRRSTPPNLYPHMYLVVIVRLLSSILAQLPTAFSH